MAAQPIAGIAASERCNTSCSGGLVSKMSELAEKNHDYCDAIPFRAHGTEIHPRPTMRDDYLQAALLVIDDPNILVNVVSRRVKQLKRGNRPLIESLEKLSAEDTALRELAERKISYELATAEDLVRLR
jgi:DNA-directed RNA polymerase subunit omega